MQTIAQHIERLLREQECVIVTGLGGFVVQHLSSRIVDGMIYPPMSEIGFNDLLTHEDGLLAQSLMQERDISFVEATTLIAAEVRKIKETLNNNGLYLLGTIGTFKHNAAGQIEFVPGKAKFLPENLGLAPIALPQLAPTTNTEQKEKSNVIHFYLPKTLLRNAAIVTLVLLLSFLSPYKKSDTQFASLWTPTWECDTMRATHFNINTEETLTLENNQTAIETTANEQTIAKKIKKAHIIIASLPSRESAQRYINNLQLQTGDEPEILEANGGTAFRVAIRNYTSAADATQELDAIHQRDGMHKAWVLGQ
ncbi:MAG: SPOR domain-containing protein [Bacteroidales bacterium]|nr:SPOR domain-containing protein [Bacteroidales bacterium]